MIEVRDVTIQAGEFALRDVSLSLAAGEYGVLMGRTGCGKSTLLEAIAGLKKVSSGQIRVADQDVTHLKPSLRGIGYVPQDGSLFMTMSVRDQIGFALTIRKVDAERIRERVDELAGLLGITDLLERRPHKLSGGERQRVVLGRALAFEPDVVLLDEPLSAVDEATKSDMCALLQDVQRFSGATILHVTHSKEEAKILADRHFQLEDGAIQELSCRDS
ncbi:MAG: molybdate/tungstate transport system ATP-binding protein [Rhodothermales bacterium]|jgi:molybdate/tungstate transport system ATP-binding protein